MAALRPASNVPVESPPLMKVWSFVDPVWLTCGADSQFKATITALVRHRMRIMPEASSQEVSAEVKYVWRFPWPPRHHQRPPFTIRSLAVHSGTGRGTPLA